MKKLNQLLHEQFGFRIGPTNNYRHALRTMLFGSIIPIPSNTWDLVKNLTEGVIGALFVSVAGLLAVIIGVLTEIGIYLFVTLGAPILALLGLMNTEPVSPSAENGVMD